MKTKKCFVCKKIKSIEQFYNNQSTCKQCNKNYYIANKNKISKQRKVYWSKNKLKIAEKRKKYREVNKEKYHIWWLKYKHTPPAIYKAIKHCAKQRNIFFNLSKEFFIQWYIKQQKICVYCKRHEKEAIKDSNRQFKRLTIDRINNNIGYEHDNILLCCHKCNLIKSNMLTHKQMLKVGKMIQQNINNGDME